MSRHKKKHKNPGASDPFTTIFSDPFVRTLMEGFIAATVGAASGSLPSGVALGGKKSWRDVLMFSPSAMPSAEQIEKRFNDLAKIHHPDKGGEAKIMRAVIEAREAARKEIAQQRKR